nr:putative reverse transcriptase domain-containing protein [Tanacetum cinerariifolium]
RYGKLQDRADGPFRVLKRINDNAFKIDLPGSYGVSATFNVADLAPYMPIKAIDTETCRHPTLQSFLEYVENHQVVCFRSLEKPKEDAFFWNCQNTTNTMILQKELLAFQT